MVFFLFIFFFLLIIPQHTIRGYIAGNKLEGDLGDIVSLQAQMSPNFHLREKFNCIEHIDKSETRLKTSP